MKNILNCIYTVYSCILYFVLIRKMLYNWSVTYIHRRASLRLTTCPFPDFVIHIYISYTRLNILSFLFYKSDDLDKSNLLDYNYKMLNINKRGIIFSHKNEVFDHWFKEKGIVL